MCEPNPAPFRSGVYEECMKVETDLMDCAHNAKCTFGKGSQLHLESPTGVRCSGRDCQGSTRFNKDAPSSVSSWWLQKV